MSLVIESKSVRVQLGQEQREQVLAYQRAIGAPCAVLTNGMRWLFFSEAGSEVADVVIGSGDDTSDLLVALEAHASRDVGLRQPWAYPRAWAIGRGIAPAPIPPANMSRLVEELSAVARSAGVAVSTRQTATGAFMLDAGTPPRAILEMKSDGSIARHLDNLRKLDVTDDLVAEYVDACASGDIHAVTNVCKDIIMSLATGR